MARIYLLILDIYHWEENVESFWAKNDNINERCWEDPGLQPWQTTEKLFLREFYYPICYACVAFKFKLIIIK